MGRWSIKGFTSAGGNNYYSNRLTPQRIADPERRLSDTDPLRTRKGKPLTPEAVAAARVDTVAAEPQRILIAVQDADTGRTQYVWVYLEDYGSKWSEVDYDKVLADIEKQYRIHVEPIEQRKAQAVGRARSLKPKPEPKPEPAPKPTPKKRSVWDRIPQVIRDAFKLPTAPTTSAEPKTPKKRTVGERVGKRIRRLFGLK